MSKDLSFNVLFAGLPDSGKKYLIEALLYGKISKKHNKTKTLEYHKAKVKYLQDVFTLTFIDLPTENTERYLNEKYIDDIDLLVCVIGKSQLSKKRKNLVDLYWKIMEVIPSVDVLLCVNGDNKIKKGNSNETEQIENIVKDIGADKFFRTSSDANGAITLLKEILHYAKQKYSIQ